MKKLLLKISAIFSTIATAGMAVSCGQSSDSSNNSSQNADDGKIEFESTFERNNPYNYETIRQNDIDNHYTNWDVSTNTFSIDLGSIFKLPKAYPSHKFGVDSTILNDVFKRDLSVPNGVDSVSRNSVSTKHLMYSWYNSTQDGIRLAKPGMYHIRPSLANGLYTANDSHTWNTEYDGVDPIDSIKKIIAKPNHKEGDSILLPVDSTYADRYFASIPISWGVNVPNVFCIKYYTKYQIIKDDGEPEYKPLDPGKEGFYLSQPTAADGSASYVRQFDWGSFEDIPQNEQLVKSGADNIVSASTISTIFSYDVTTSDLKTIYTSKPAGTAPIDIEFHTKFDEPLINTDGEVSVGLSPLTYVENSNISGEITRGTSNIKFNDGSGNSYDIYGGEALQYLQPTNSATNWIFRKLQSMNRVIGENDNYELFTPSRFNINSQTISMVDAIIENRLWPSFPYGKSTYSAKATKYLDANHLAFIKTEDQKKMLFNKYQTVLHILRSDLGYEWNSKITLTDSLNVVRTFYTKYSNGDNIPKIYWGFYETQPATVDECQDQLSADSTNPHFAYAADNLKWGQKLIYDKAGSTTPHETTYREPADVYKLRYEFALSSSGQYVAPNGITVSPIKPDNAASTFVKSSDNTYVLASAGSSVNAAVFARANYIQSPTGKKYTNRMCFDLDENGNAITSGSTLDAATTAKYQLPAVLMGFYDQSLKLSLQEFNTAVANHTLKQYMDKWLELRLIPYGDIANSDGTDSAMQYKYNGKVYEFDNVNGFTMPLSYRVVNEVSSRGGFQTGLALDIASPNEQNIIPLNAGAGFGFMLSKESFMRFFDLNSSTSRVWPLPNKISIKFLFNGVELKTLNNMPSELINEIYKMDKVMFEEFDTEDLPSIVKDFQIPESISESSFKYPFTIMGVICNDKASDPTQTLGYLLAQEMKKFVIESEV